MWERSKNIKHLYGIDGLKGIGACMVAFGGHYQHFNPQTGSAFIDFISFFYAFSGYCVDFFFMLSGFGMMIGYGARIITNEISFKEFISRRIKKLYPIFLFCTVLTIILEIMHLRISGDTFVYKNFDIQHLFMNLLLIQNGYIGTGWSFDGPSWCISISFFCYMVFYFVLYKAKNKTTSFYVFGVFAILGLAIIASNISVPILNSLIGRGVCCFSIGCILSGIYVNRNRFRSKKLGWICLITAVIVFFIIRLYPKFAGNFRVAFILGFSPTVLLATVLLPWVNSFLGVLPLRYLGEISIEIYLLHFPIQCFIKNMELIKIGGGGKLF